MALYECKITAERSVLVGNRGLDINNTSIPEWHLRSNYWGPGMTALLKNNRIGGSELPNIIGRVRLDGFLVEFPKGCGATIVEISGQKLW